MFVKTSILFFFVSGNILKMIVKQKDIANTLFVVLVIIKNIVFVANFENGIAFYVSFFNTLNMMLLFKSFIT